MADSNSSVQILLAITYSISNCDCSGFKHLLWCLLFETSCNVEACAALVAAHGADVVPRGRAVRR